jgi:hypothetical protein
MPTGLATANSPALIMRRRCHSQTTRLPPAVPSYEHDGPAYDVVKACAGDIQRAVAPR